MAGIHLPLCSTCSPSIPTFVVSIAISMVGIHLLRCSHLALTDEGFRIFLDTHHLHRGENISEALQHAIENSRILIPIFSTNYAESPSCLREVSLIAHQVQDKGKKGSAIVSLFYDVAPSQVGHPDQSHGSPFVEAVPEHESSGQYSPQEIDEWKSSMCTISHLSGWSLQEDTNGYETAMVKLVVEYLAKTVV